MMYNQQKKQGGTFPWQKYSPNAGEGREAMLP
jgi:hypothetical protein